MGLNVGLKMRKIWFQQLQDECHKIPHIPIYPRKLLLESLKCGKPPYCTNGNNCQSVIMGGSGPCRQLCKGICYLCHLQKTNELYGTQNGQIHDFIVITGWVGEYQLKYMLPLLDRIRGLFGPFPIFNRNHYHWHDNQWLESDILINLGGKSDRVLHNHPAGEGEVLYPIKPRIFRHSTITLCSIEESLRFSYANKLHRVIANAVFRETLQESYNLMLPWLTECKHFNLDMALYICRGTFTDLNAFMTEKDPRIIRLIKVHHGNSNETLKSMLANPRTNLDWIGANNPTIPTNVPPTWTPKISPIGSNIWRSIIWLRVNLAAELKDNEEKINLFLKAHIPVLRYLDSNDDDIDVPYLCSLYQSLGDSHYDEDRNLFKIETKKIAPMIPHPPPWTIETIECASVAELRADGYDPHNMLSEIDTKINIAVFSIMQKCKQAYHTTTDTALRESLWFYHGCFIDFVYNCYGVKDRDLVKLLQIHYPHPNRCFTGYDLPDVYHLLITIPLAGKEYVPPFTLGTFIQKSLPNCCVSRTLVEDVNHAMKTDVAFCKVFSSLYYCLYMDMYPEDMMISGATRNFDVARLCRAKIPEEITDCNIIYAVFRMWIIMMARGQEYQLPNDFIQNTYQLANVIRSSPPGGPKGAPTIPPAMHNPRNKRYHKKGVIESLLEITKPRLLSNYMDSAERSTGIMEVKEQILNRLLFTNPSEWLQVEGLPISDETRELVLKMLNIYQTNAKPQNFKSLIDGIPFEEFQIITWYFNIINKLQQLDFESVTLSHIDQLDETKKRNLYIGEHISPYAYDVFVSLCCNKIKTLQSNREYGHDNVSFDIERNMFVCAKHPKKIVVDEYELEQIPKKKKIRDERNQFYEIPCKGNPVLRVQLYGFVLIYEKKGRFTHCPKCSAFHKIDWTGWYGGTYQCPECLQLKYHYTCCVCSLPVTKTYNLMILDTFSPRGIEDAFQRLYFCRNHFTIAKRENWGIPKERLFEIVREKKKWSGVGSLH
jgi:hypothetical protein